MYNANKPDLSELPTTNRLLKSTAIAAGVAAVLLTTVVLPAEYGVDPTRIGSVLGLTEMGRIKRQLAQEAEAEAKAAEDALAAAKAAPAAQTGAPVAAAPEATASAPTENTAPPVSPPVDARAAAAKPAPAAAAPAASAPRARTDQTLVVLEPDAATEIKLVMKQGAKVRFKWASSGGKVNFDTHADAPGIDYHGYGKGSAQSQDGELTAEFDGSHGWFWRNRTGEQVTITLDTTGAYSEIKRY